MIGDERLAELIEFFSDKEAVQIPDLSDALRELQRLRAEKREDECLDKILRNAAERARGK